MPRWLPAAVIVAAVVASLIAYTAPPPPRGGGATSTATFNVTAPAPRVRLHIAPGDVLTLKWVLMLIKGRNETVIDEETETVLVELVKWPYIVTNTGAIPIEALFPRFDTRPSHAIFLSHYLDNPFCVIPTWANESSGTYFIGLTRGCTMCAGVAELQEDGMLAYAWMDTPATGGGVLREEVIVLSHVSHGYTTLEAGPYICAGQTATTIDYTAPGVYITTKKGLLYLGKYNYTLGIAYIVKRDRIGEAVWEAALHGKIPPGIFIVVSTNTYHITDTDVLMVNGKIKAVGEDVLKWLG